MDSAVTTTTTNHQRPEPTAPESSIPSALQGPTTTSNNTTTTTTNATTATATLTDEATRKPVETPSSSSGTTRAVPTGLSATTGKLRRCVMCAKRFCGPDVVTLPCHPVCRLCMDLLVGYRDQANVVQCVRCLRHYPMTELWREQFDKNKVSQRNDDTDSGEIRPCHRCKLRSRGRDVPHAEYFCYQCQQPLCRHCHRLLHTPRPSSSSSSSPTQQQRSPWRRRQRQRRRRRCHHIVIPLAPADWSHLTHLDMTLCSSHGGQPLSVFCLACRVSVCDVCHELEHADHGPWWGFRTNLQNARNTLLDRLNLLLEQKKLVSRLLHCLRSLVVVSSQLPAPASYTAESPSRGAEEVSAGNSYHSGQNQRRKRKDGDIDSSACWDEECPLPQRMKKTCKRTLRQKRLFEPAGAETPDDNHRQVRFGGLCLGELSTGTQPSDTPGVSSFLSDTVTPSGVAVDSATSTDMSQSDMLEPHSDSMHNKTVQYSPDTAEIIQYHSTRAQTENAQSHSSATRPEITRSHSETVWSEVKESLCDAAQSEILQFDCETTRQSCCHSAQSDILHSDSETTQSETVSDSDSTQPDSLHADSDTTRSETQLQSDIVQSHCASTGPLSLLDSLLSVEVSLLEYTPLAHVVSSLDSDAESSDKFSDSESSVSTSSEVEAAGTPLWNWAEGDVTVVSAQPGSVSPQSSLSVRCGSSRCARSPSDSELLNHTPTSSRSESQSSSEAKMVSVTALDDAQSITATTSHSAPFDTLLSRKVPSCLTSKHVLSDVTSSNSATSDIKASHLTPSSSSNASPNTTQSDAVLSDISAPNCAPTETVFSNSATNSARPSIEPSDVTPFFSSPADTMSSNTVSSSCPSSEVMVPDADSLPADSTSSDVESSSIPLDTVRSDTVLPYSSLPQAGIPDTGQADHHQAASFDNHVVSCSVEAERQIADNDDNTVVDTSSPNDHPEIGDQGTPQNNEMAEMVREVFGDSLLRLVEDVQTVHGMLDGRVAELAYDLYNDKLGSLCSTYPWMNARPVISEAVHATLKAMFPDGTSSSSSTSNTTVGPSFWNNSAMSGRLAQLDSRFDGTDSYTAESGTGPTATGTGTARDEEYDDYGYDDSVTSDTGFTAADDCTTRVDYCSHSNTRNEQDVLVLAEVAGGGLDAQRNGDLNIYSLLSAHKSDNFGTTAMGAAKDNDVVPHPWFLG